MSTKLWHVNDKGEVGKCEATIPTDCKFYVDESDPRCFIDFEDAVRSSEVILEKASSKQKVVRDKNSFLSDYEERMRGYEERFSDFPSSFASAKIWGKRTDVMHRVLDDLGSREFSPEERYAFNSLGAYYQRYAMVLSSPSDAKKMTLEDRVGFMSELGCENIEHVDDEKVLRAFDASSGTIADINGVRVLVVDSTKKFDKKLASRYSIRGNPAFGQVAVVDVRTLAGLVRVKREIGANLLDEETALDKAAVDLRARRITRDEYDQVVIRRQVSQLMNALSMRQLQAEHEAYRDQKDYMRDEVKKISTILSDKKNIDDVHREMASSTSLRDYFSHVEFDNDVAPEKAQRFADDIRSTFEAFPELRPRQGTEIRIRHLGKHGSVSGLYQPRKRVVALSVNNGSGSAVHELSHAFDFQTGGASLDPEFVSVVARYKRTLSLTGGSDREYRYYGTPTEVFARGFEVYAHEKRGVSGSALDTSRFDTEPFAPFHDEDLKSKMFEFFDRKLQELSSE